MFNVPLEDTRYTSIEQASILLKISSKIRSECISLHSLEFYPRLLPGTLPEILLGILSIYLFFSELANKEIFCRIS